MRTIEQLEKQYKTTKSELQDFYNSHSNAEVANLLGLSKTQTLRVINEFGLIKKVAYKKHIKVDDIIKSIDIEDFKKDYYKMTQKDMASKYNITLKQVIEVREKLNLEFRKLWKTTDEYEINPEELENFYKTHTLQETVDHFNIGSIGTLKALLKKNSIEIDSRISNYVEDLKYKISKEDLANYYATHTLKETCEHFNCKTISSLIKYYGLAKSKTRETFESIKNRIDKESFATDYNSLNTYELMSKYGVAYTSYRKLVKYFDLGYKPGIFAFKDASISTCEDSLFLYVRSIVGENTCIKRNDRTVLNGREIDIYLPDYKLCIEFNGDYWHCDLKRDKNYHFEKAKLAQEKGIRLIFIWEYEWHNIETQNKIKQLLKIALNKVETKIFARACEVRRISNAEAKILNEQIHLQGHRNAQVTYGLFYMGGLVQLMSFSRTKYNKNLKSEDEWEIIRGCPGSNNIVTGGVSRLFKHFIDDFSPTKVFSYCDFNKFNGKSYEAIGMHFVGFTGPDLKYKLNDGTVVNRSPKNYKYNNSHCVYRLYGAGSKKYEWTRE